MRGRQVLVENPANNRTITGLFAFVFEQRAATFDARVLDLKRRDCSNLDLVVVLRHGRVGRGAPEATGCEQGSSYQTDSKADARVRLSRREFSVLQGVMVGGGPFSASQTEALVFRTVSS